MSLYPCCRPQVALFSIVSQIWHLYNLSWSFCRGAVVIFHLFKNWSSGTRPATTYQQWRRCTVFHEKLNGSSWIGCQSWMFCFLLLTLKGIWKQQEWSIGIRLLIVQDSQWREFQIGSHSSVLISFFQQNQSWILSFCFFFYFQFCLLLLIFCSYTIYRFGYPSFSN